MQMRSVKELGQSLRRRQGTHEVAAGAEEALHRAAGSTSSAILVVAGCIALCAGALIASAQVIAPQHSWIARNLGRMGIESGALLAGGAALLGAGLVGRTLAQAQRLILGALRRGSGLTRLGEDLAQLREDVGKVHFALRVLHESLKSLVESSHEQALERGAKQHDDAVFQLAGSVDQFRLRFEDLLVGQQSGLDRRFAELDANLREMRRKLSELTAQIESSRARATHVPPAPLRPAEGAGPAQEHGRSRSSAGLSPSERIPDEPSPRVEHRPPSEHAAKAEDLVSDEPLVLVTLEDAEGLAGPAIVEPRAAEPKESDFTPTSLGVLDILDDFGIEIAEEGEGSDGGRIDASSLYGDELGREIEGEARSSKEDHAGAQPAGAGSAQAADTDEKLVQLRTLLADSRLRRALEGMQSSEARMGSASGVPEDPGAHRA